MAFGMFAFVTLGDEYFAYGAMAGLISAVIAGVVMRAARRPLDARLRAAHHHDVLSRPAAAFPVASRRRWRAAAPSVSATLLVFFAIVLLGGLFQALFGILRLGSLIKFAPHPVMAGFQNMAAVLLFLVQLGNVLGYRSQHSLHPRVRSDRRGAAVECWWSPR